ncbi:hypothetical protein SCLCIDRAFT_28454 [Scleroderma citrinum Foug A]|uniref:F-box domain-containing protein n=1 Tax=Scleroderma citrinum Foug A TaxID=1036808 RepID=A0A0C3DNX8_9AGAM|nr:hypothetical protein SCLCIDRAFT_28454 [Scleroderma citrinum Foug A]
MDSLAQARVELARLEAEAQELVKQLLCVRAAVSVQRSKISQLLRRTPPPIHRLPTELLLSIFELDISAHPDCERKQELARVSRRWRDVILNSPILWTTINIPRLNASGINAHLKKSGESLLNIAITINGQGNLDYDKLTPYLDIVTPYAHRWRSLHVFDVSGPESMLGEIITPIGMYIVEVINHLRFPSLKHVIIPFFGGIEYPDFLSPTCAPGLEHLELEGMLPCKSFAPPPTLKTLRLMADDFDEAPHPFFAYLIPTQRLTTLSLSRDIADWNHWNHWILRPNSIHFPVLNTLTLSISQMNQFLHAIEHPLSVVFNGLGHKFNNVDHISFPRTTRFNRSHDYDGALSVCKTFPNVRHAELNLQELGDLFPDRSFNAESTHIRYPAYLWKDLQSLTLRGPSFKWVKKIDYFSEWLLRRQTLGLPLFHIKLTDFGRYPESRAFLDDHSERLHDCLGYYCSLEFDIPMITKKINMSRVADTSLRMHFPELTSGFTNDLASAFLAVDDDRR